MKYSREMINLNNTLKLSGNAYVMNPWVPIEEIVMDTMYIEFDTLPAAQHVKEFCEALNNTPAVTKLVIDLNFNKSPSEPIAYEILASVLQKNTSLKELKICARFMNAGSFALLKNLFLNNDVLEKFAIGSTRNKGQPLNTDDVNALHEVITQNKSLTQLKVPQAADSGTLRVICNTLNNSKTNLQIFSLNDIEPAEITSKLKTNIITDTWATNFIENFKTHALIEIQFNARTGIHPLDKILMEYFHEKNLLRISKLHHAGIIDAKDYQTYFENYFILQFTRYILLMKDKLDAEMLKQYWYYIDSLFHAPTIIIPNPKHENDASAQVDNMDAKLTTLPSADRSKQIAVIAALRGQIRGLKFLDDLENTKLQTLIENTLCFIDKKPMHFKTENTTELKRLIRSAIQDGYIKWMAQNANKARISGGRFSHWHHGESGLTRAYELLSLINTDVTYEETFVKLQETIKASGKSKHSLGRFLINIYLSEQNKVAVIDSEHEMSDRDYANIKIQIK